MALENLSAEEKAAGCGECWQSLPESMGPNGTQHVRARALADQWPPGIHELQSCSSDSP